MSIASEQEKAALRGFQIFSKAQLPDGSEAQTTEPAKEEAPKIVFFSEVEPEDPQWLIKPYIPVGAYTILQGDSGVGKTALACKIAATVSRGTPFDNIPCEKGKVLILSTEDAPSVLRARIEASGGDLRQCAFIPDPYKLQFNDSIIEEQIKHIKAKLVIFDPLQSFLGSKTDMYRANETRPIMAALAAMAKHNECAIVIISHMHKGQGKAIYKALGSVDIVGASRSVLHIGRNPDNKDQCAIVQIKSSMAKQGCSLLYEIGHNGGVAMKGQCDLTADDIETERKRQEKGITYEEEPLVQIYRSLMTESDNQGGKYSYDKIEKHGFDLLGYYPFKDSRNCNSETKRLSRELLKRDRILAAPYRSSSERGMELSYRKPISNFQVTIKE